MEILGVDIGFGFTKATNGRDVRIFKSVIGEATDMQFQESLLKAGDGEGPTLHVALDDKTYFIGELAEKQSSVRSYTLDQGQLIARFAKTLALTAIANMAKPGEPIRLVTGLPINYYRRHKDELTSLLEGQHQITLIAAGNERTDCTIFIDKVRVIPQPFGSVFNLMLNDIGRISDRTYAEQKIGVIDVGFRTADYSICDKTQYSERGSQTSDAGMSQAYKVIAHGLQEKSGINVELYRLYEAIEQSAIKIHGKNYGLRRITELAYGQLASTVASDVNRLWSDDWDIDRIVITGGGGAALLSYLQPLLQGELVAVESADDARLNNVRGYRKYGAHLWDRPSA